MSFMPADATDSDGPPAEWIPSEAPAPAPPPPPVPARARAVPPGIQPDKERNRRLRELRDEIQDLRVALEHVAKGEATLLEYADYIRGTREDVEELLRDIPGADPVRHVTNLWEQIGQSTVIKDPTTAFDPQTLMLQLSLLDTLCRKLVFQVGMITIPERVNDWLRMERPGYYLPFHAVFEDELPDLEDRVRVLNYLAWAPNAVESGLVDAETGLIYRYSPDKRDRRRSFWGVVLALVLATLFIVVVTYLPIQDWVLQPSHLGPLLIGWFAVIIGIIVHIGVGTAKRAQSREGRPPIIAAGDIFLLIDARFGHILLKMLLAMVGFFGLVFTAGPESVTPFSAFLVGYSLDSVVEMFSASLEQRSGDQVLMLKQRLGLDSEG